MLSGLLLPIGLGLLLLALALLILLFNERHVRRQRQEAERYEALGLPPGELVYEDADGQGETLSSSRYPLKGKPDYIVKLPDGRPVPVELKLGVHDVTAPYSNHVMQLMSYCLILEDYFTVPPTHGILRYGDRDFTLEYTPALRKKVIRILSEMGHLNSEEQPMLAKQRAAKCRSCAFQSICPIGHNK